MSNQVENCGNCRHCGDIDYSLSEQTGLCLRYPPTVCFDQVTESFVTAPHPSVAVDEWCGEWKQTKEVMQ